MTEVRNFGEFHREGDSIYPDPNKLNIQSMFKLISFFFVHR